MNRGETCPHYPLRPPWPQTGSRVRPGGRDAAAPGSRAPAARRSRRCAAGHAGRPRVHHHGAFQRAQVLACSSCSRCGAQPLQLPAHDAHRGAAQHRRPWPHGFAVPECQVPYRGLAQPSVPIDKGRVVVALAGGLAQQIGLGHFAHMLDRAACVRARPAPATGAGGPAGRRCGADQQARARAGTGDGEFTGGEYTVAVSDRSGGPAWIAARRCASTSSGSAAHTAPASLPAAGPDAGPGRAPSRICRAVKWA